MPVFAVSVSECLQTLRSWCNGQPESFLFFFNIHTVARIKAPKSSRQTSEEERGNIATKSTTTEEAYIITCSLWTWPSPSTLACGHLELRMLLLMDCIYIYI